MMKAVYRCCCGIDVHKKLIVARLKKGGRQEVRELTRYRKSLTKECSREPGRLQKVLEGATVKLAAALEPAGKVDAHKTDQYTVS